MVNVVIPIVIGIIIFFMYLMRAGKRRFWKIAAKHPDQFYEHIKKDNAWVLSKKDNPGIELDGPFLLYIPKLSQTVKFYGIVGKYEDSQRRFETDIVNH